VGSANINHRVTQALSNIGLLIIALLVGFLILTRSALDEDGGMHPSSRMGVGGSSAADPLLATAGSNGSDRRYRSTNQSSHSVAIDTFYHASG